MYNCYSMTLYMSLTLLAGMYPLLVLQADGISALFLGHVLWGEENKTAWYTLCMHGTLFCVHMVKWNTEALLKS